MKRVIALFMSGMMLLSLAACASDGGRSRDTRDTRDTREENISFNETSKTQVDLDELRRVDGPMLEITTTIRLPLPEDEDPDSTLILGYDGMITNPDDTSLSWGPISDEDYLTFYTFCVESVEDNPFADYFEDVCDGQTYRFVFYDEDGDAHEIYDGYIYENEELSAVNDLLYSCCHN